MKQNAIELNNVWKRYGSTVALRGVSFSVRAGEIFALLGPNGAGKTTALACMEGLLRPDSGSVSVLGQIPTRDRRRLNRHIGVQLQAGALPDHMRVDEAMKLFAAYRRVAPDFALLERLGLGAKVRAQYHTLSAGQKRRLELALAVAHRPSVVFLDEPTASLDVETRAALHDLLRELREQGTTIVLSTHDMAEAESLADHVVILVQGSVVTSGTPKQITAAGSSLTKVSVRTATRCFDGAPFPGIVRSEVQGEYTIYFTDRPAASVSAILDHIEASGTELIDLRVERPTLEERFLELTRNTVVSA